MLINYTTIFLGIVRMNKINFFRQNQKKEEKWLTEAVEFFPTKIMNIRVMSQ